MFTLHFRKSRGPVKALNGVNLGPVDRFYGIDLSSYFKKARIASVRTHDCNRSIMDAVDLHYIFPEPNADPEDPANYRFGTTDDYLAAIRAAGCEVYFRLGESIESIKSPRKVNVVAGRWKPKILARVCVNIARHYNEGWSSGFEWNIAHWQFWNEPSNSWVVPAEKRPCWTGTTEEFYALYGAVARAMKAHNPAWKIGLAGYGRPDFIFPEGHPQFKKENPWRHIGDIVNSGPIDSISWHQYGASWETLALSAEQVRACLDANGLAHAESHITEWNYNPWLEDEKGRYTWFHARQDQDFERLERVIGVISGVEGAAYLFGVLSRLQDAPVELAHLYTGNTSPALGLFTAEGRPRKKFVGMEEFGQFLDYDRVAINGGVHDSITGMAAVKGSMARIGIAHLRPEVKECSIEIDTPHFQLQSARQFLDDGWRDIEVNAAKAECGAKLILPIGGSGLTILTGAIDL